MRSFVGLTSGGLLVLLSPTMVACGGESKASAGTPATPTTGGAGTTTITSTATASRRTTTSTSLGAGTTTSAAPVIGEQVPVGTYDVYLRSSGTTTDVAGRQVKVVTYDQVQLLTGKAAVDTAHQRHLIPPDQDHVDNDRLIVNDNTRLRTLPLADAAQVTILGCDGGCADKPMAITIEGALAQRPDGLFTLVVALQGSGSIVTKVSQRFLP